MIDTKTIQVNPSGNLLWHDKIYRCALGRSGITLHKKEGDGATPAGRYTLREVFYRPDRLAKPKTNLPVSRLCPTDGWSDDPTRSDYNSKVILPYNGSAEELWREDTTYDLIVVIGYNDQPVIPILGSAIFIHIAKENYTPTAGCIALRHNDLIEILATLSPTTQISITNTI